MMTIFEQALADLFADRELATNAVWRAAGQGPAVTVQALVRRPDRVADFGGTRVVASAVLIEIRVAEAPSLAAGDTLEFDGEIHVVQGEPMRDATRLIWVAEARPA